MAKSKRKVTMDKSKVNKEGESPPKRQSVFDRLGPGSSSLSANATPQPRSSGGDWQEKCRNWLRHGTCQFGNKCKYQHDPPSRSGSKQKERGKEKDDKVDSSVRSKVSAKRATSHEKSRTPSPKRSESRRRRSHSRSSRGEHEGKIKSQVVVTQRSSSAATVSADKRRQSRNWGEDADRGHLDFEEELTLEKKRQELQRELELEMQKEKLLQSKRENVIINKVISSSSCASSSSSSSDSSSSSSSSKSSSSEDEMSSSGSSSRAEVSKTHSSANKNLAENRKKAKEKRSKSSSGEDTRKARRGREKTRRKKKSGKGANLVAQAEGNSSQNRGERTRGSRSQSGSISKGGKHGGKESKGKNGAAHHPKKRISNSLLQSAERPKQAIDRHKHRSNSVDVKIQEKHPHKKKKPKERIPDSREDVASRSSSRVRDASREHSELHRKLPPRPTTPPVKETKKARRKADAHSPLRKLGRHRQPGEEWTQAERVPQRLNKMTRGPMGKEGNMPKNKGMGGKVLMGVRGKKLGNRGDKDRNMNLPSLFAQKHGVPRRSPLMAKKLAVAAAGAAKKRALEKSLRAMADSSRIPPLFSIRTKATKKDKGMFRRARLDDPGARDQRLLPSLDSSDQSGRMSLLKLIPNHLTKDSDSRRNDSREKERTWESLPRRAPLSPQHAVFAEWERAEREREKGRDRMRLEKDRDRDLDKGRNLSAERRVGREREQFGHRSYEGHLEPFEQGRRDRPASPQQTLSIPRSPEQRKNTPFNRRQDAWDGKRNKPSHDDRVEAGEWKKDEETRGKKRSRDRSKDDAPASKRIRTSPAIEEIPCAQPYSGVQEDSESGSVKSKRMSGENVPSLRERHEDKSPRARRVEKMAISEEIVPKVKLEVPQKTDEPKRAKKRQNTSTAEGTEPKKRRKAEEPLPEVKDGTKQVPSLPIKDSEEKSVVGDVAAPATGNLSDWSEDSDDLLNRLEDQQAQRAAEVEKEKEHEKEKDKDKGKDKESDGKDTSVDVTSTVPKRRERPKKGSPSKDANSVSSKSSTRSHGRGGSRETGRRSRRRSREVGRVRSVGPASRCNSGERVGPSATEAETTKPVASEREESADKPTVPSNSAVTCEEIPCQPEVGKDTEDSLQSDGKCVAGDTNDYDPISDEELEAILEDNEDVTWQKTSDQSDTKPGIIDALDVDWSSLTSSKDVTKSEDPVPADVLRRFEPVNILARIGISENLLGETMFEKIRMRCQQQMSAPQTDDSNKVESAPEFKMENKLAMFHALAMVKKRERATIFDSFGPHRRALCARRDLEIRRRLCNFHDKDQGSLPTTSDSEVFSSAVQLFKFGKLVPAS